MGKITPQISGKFVITVAGIYTDFNRAVMEYIDNSIDSSEKYFDDQTDKYKEKIKIKIAINENKQIIIQDNCEGIRDLNSLIREIGNSKKKAGFATNGQFGFGIYSFMEGCSSLKFYSKHDENQECHYLEILREKFDKEKVDEIKIDEAKVSQEKITRGTKVILSGFKNAIWKDVDKERLKEYIADHFELVIRKRENILIYVNDEEVRPYSYSGIEGEEWEDEIKEANYTPRKQKVGEKIPFDPPIKVYLKMCRDQEVKRPPSFFIKGRKINEVKNISSFESRYSSKARLWGHPQITGYIDLKGHFEPTIKRDDFKNAKEDKFKAFNQGMKELEGLIHDEFIERVNKEKQDKSFNQLASEINKRMKNFDPSLNFQSINLSKEKSDKGHPMEDGHGGKDQGENKGSKGDKGSIGVNEGDGIGPNLDKEGKDIFESGEKKNRRGFPIIFTDEECIKTQDGKGFVRSRLEEESDKHKTIKIYKQHEEFKSRQKVSKLGELKITDDLISYISSEMSIHYRDEFYKKNEIPSEYQKDILENFVELIYKIENQLKPLVGKTFEEMKI